MTPGPVPVAGSVRHRLAGAALRRHRELAGLDLADAAAVLGCDRSKVSRMECGERGIRLADLRRLLAEYGADAGSRRALEALAGARNAKSWWKPYQGVLAPAQVDLLAAEAAAVTISGYAPLQVPGLLQAPEYAGAAGDPGVPGDAAGIPVAAAADRQDAIVRSGRAGISIVIALAAIAPQPFGDAAMIRRQARHLASLAAGCPSLCLQLLPVPPWPCPAGGSGGFRVLGFSAAQVPRLVVVDGPSGGLPVDDPEAVAAYEGSLARLQEQALAPEETIIALKEIAGG